MRESERRYRYWWPYQVGMGAAVSLIAVVAAWHLGLAAGVVRESLAQALVLGAIGVILGALAVWGGWMCYWMAGSLVLDPQAKELRFEQWVGRIRRVGLKTAERWRGQAYGWRSRPGDRVIVFPDLLAEEDAFLADVVWPFDEGAK